MLFNNLHPFSTIFKVKKNSSTGLHLEDLTPQQLQQLGMIRDPSGEYFHVTNTEDGGYHLSPALKESIAGAVAGAQRQAQRSQQQTQQNDQSALMKKISENAVDQFQVNIQAIVRIVALSPIVYVGFIYLQDTIKHPAYAHLSIIVTIQEFQTHSFMQQRDL